MRVTATLVHYLAFASLGFGDEDTAPSSSPNGRVEAHSSLNALAALLHFAPTASWQGAAHSLGASRVAAVDKRQQLYTARPVYGFVSSRLQSMGANIRALRMLEDSQTLPVLISSMLKMGEPERTAAMENAVQAWAPADRQRLSDEMTKLLTQRAVEVQTSAKLRHARGEDVTAASAELQAIVDMTVHVKILVRNLRSSSTD